MALHSCDAITVYAAVAMRPHTDCSSMEGHTSLSTALVYELEVSRSFQGSKIEKNRGQDD